MNLLHEMPAENKVIFAIVGIMYIIYLLSEYGQNKKYDLTKLRGKNLCSGKKGTVHGILFGLRQNKIIYSPCDREGHIAVWGGSGLGKTSALLIPTLRSWTGTFFTVDISGDISSNVTVENKLLFDPGDAQNSVPYNIFGAIDLLPDHLKNEALERIAFLLMPDLVRADSFDRFFTGEGRKILTASLIAFYWQGFDFIQIAEKVVRTGWQDLFTEIDNTGNMGAIQYIGSFEGANERNTAGCKQAVDTVLKLFATNEKIKKTIRRPGNGEVAYTPEALEKYNVFIKIADAYLELYAPILHIIVAQTLEYLSERPAENKKKILLALDEFASLGKLEITPALRKLRKKHVRIMVLTQSMADIDLIYGRAERMAMMPNFAFKVLLSVGDSDTQRYFADLIGKMTVNKKSYSRSSKTSSRTITKEQVYIIDPAELARLKNHLLVLYPDGCIKLRKNFYFK